MSAFIFRWVACVYTQCSSSALLTYRQNEINHVHDAQSHITNVSPTIGVCDVHQETRHTVVEKHLPKIFPSFFQVDGKKLLQPEGERDEEIPFELSR